MQYLNYRENRQRGTADFPFEFHHVTRIHPDYVMPLHWHTEFELIRILKGALLLSVANRDYKLNEGDFVIIPSNLPHTAIPNACEYECIVFDAKCLLGKNDSSNRFITELLEHSIIPQYVFPSSEARIHFPAWALFDSLASKKPGHEMLVFGSLYVILGVIMENHLYKLSSERSEYGFRKSIKLQQAMNYMEESFRQHLSLEDIATKIGMTPQSFCRFFKDMAHCSPIDYLNSYRIERSCYQLLTTNLSVTEIAFENGFNDLSYFIKTFKKYKGTTPKKYMKTIS